MNRWLTIRRLRGPAFLLLFGVTALLNQWGILSFGRSWPLYLILLGVLSLMERAAFRDEVTEPAATGYAQPSYASPTSIVPHEPPMRAASEASIEEPTSIREGERE